MDDLRALTVLTQHYEEINDDEVKDALLVFVPELTHLPPTAVGHAAHEARQLARQFTKTGFLGEWSTPPRHSRAMERLVHRLTCVLEAMLNLLTVANNEKELDS